MAERVRLYSNYRPSPYLQDFHASRDAVVANIGTLGGRFAKRKSSRSRRSLTVFIVVSPAESRCCSNRRASRALASLISS